MTKAKNPPNPEGKPVVVRPRIMLVYIRPCTLSDGKVGAEFAVIDDQQFADKCLPDPLPALRVYGGDLPKKVGRPGSIYSFEYGVDETHLSLYPGTSSWAGFLENDDRVQEWQMEHDTFYAAIEAERLEKKGKQRNVVHEQLLPIKVAYSKARGRQRAALLALVIGYITGQGD